MRLDLDGLAAASREALMAEWHEVVARRPPETPSTICSKGFPQYLLADTGQRYFPRRAIQLKQCGSFPQLNTFGMFCGECSSPTYLQHLCCQRFSCSSFADALEPMAYNLLIP